MRAANADDFETLLRLNAEWERFTSPLDHASLLALHMQAAYHRVVESDGDAVAFLLALREGATYASPNYRWFAARYERFLYVDRLIVSAGSHRGGLGSVLYDDLIAFARATHAPRVVCELDIDPPNAASAAFHDRYGFTEVGRQAVAGGAKRVSLRELALPHD